MKMATETRLRKRIEIIQEIAEMRGNNGDGMSWSAIAFRYGVSKPCVYRLFKEPDYTPGIKNRVKLRMEYELPMPVCPIHGVVHDYDCQTQEIQPKRNGRPKRKKDKPYPYHKINKFDAKSAARSIRRNCGEAFVAALVELLEQK